MEKVLVSWDCERVVPKQMQIPSARRSAVWMTLFYWRRDFVGYLDD